MCYNVQWPLPSACCMHKSSTRWQQDECGLSEMAEWESLIVSMVFHAIYGAHCLSCNVYVPAQWALVGHLNYSWRCDKFSATHVVRKSTNPRNIAMYYSRCAPHFPSTTPILRSSLLTIMLVFHIIISIKKSAPLHTSNTTLETRIILPCSSICRFSCVPLLPTLYFGSKWNRILAHAATLSARMVLVHRWWVNHVASCIFLGTTYHNSRTNSNTTSTISVWYNVTETNT